MQFINQKLNPALAIAILLTSSIGFVAANLFPTTIEFWAILLVLSLIISVVGMLRWHTVEDIELEQNDKSKSGIRRILESLSGLLPFLIFTPAIIAFINLPDAFVSHHGDLHANYIIQILYGRGIPDNGFFPESPINYYWLYHAMVATISYLFNLPFPIGRAILSIVIALATWGWASQCLHIIVPKRLHPVVSTMLTLLLLFGFNVLGIVYSLGDYARSDLIVNLAPSDPISSLLFSNLVNKFLNFTAFPIQIMFLWMGLYAILRLLQEPPKIYLLFLLLVSIGGGLAAQLSGGLFIGISLIPAAIFSDIVSVFLAERRLNFGALVEHYRAKIQYIRDTWSKQGWAVLIVTFLLLIPILIYTIEFMNQIPNVTGFQFKNLYGIIGIVSTTFGIMPFLLLAGVLSIIRANHIILTCVVATAISWAMYYFLTIPYGNQYKFMLLSTTFFMPAAIWAMFQVRVSLQENEKYISLGISLSLILASLVLFNITLSGIQLYERYRDSQYVFEGRHVMMPEHPYSDVFTWIRDNTDPDTVLVMDIRQTRYAAILSERSAYLVEKQFSLANGIEEYDQRLWVAMTFVLSHRTIEDRQEALNYIEPFGERHPLVFIVPDEANISADELDSLGMVLLYDGEIASVYKKGSN